MELLVSIIVPCFNASKYIEETILSILGQSYPNWEMIIIDDCSTDRSVDVVSKYLDDDRIKLHYQEMNTGPGLARNAGIAIARGSIIAFIDSDDLWSPDKLESQIAYFVNNPEAAVVFCDYEQMDENGNTLGRVIKAPAVVDYKMLLKSNFIGGLTGAYNASLIGKRYSIAHGHEDYVLWLSILKDGYKAYNLQRSLAQYRILPSSRSSNKFKTALYQWSVYRDVERLSLFMSLYMMAFYILYGIKKHF